MIATVGVPEESPDPVFEPLPELEPVFELSEDPFDAVESVFSPDPELEEEPEPESEDPVLLFPLEELVLLLAVSEEELDPELESFGLPEFPEEDPDVLEVSEVFELEEV